MKQAESASRAAETFMKSGNIDSEPADLTEMKEELAKAQKEAESAKKDRDSMKNQSESLAKEYDRYVDLVSQPPLALSLNRSNISFVFSLMEEKDKLERKVNIMGSEKKDD